MRPIIAIILCLCSPFCSLATDPALPEGIPDYSGVTGDNFFSKIPESVENTVTEYVMPKIDPAKALIVDVDGIGGKPSDENPGTVEKSFQSLARAAREIKPGVIILLRKGTYPLHEGVTINGAAGQKGTREQPALISSYPGEIATLVGATPVQGWTRLKESPVYFHDLAAAPSRLIAIWANGRILPPIRHYLSMTTVKPPFKDKNFKPLEEGSPLSAPGTWAIDGLRLFLRLADDSDPNKARIELNAPPKDSGSLTFKNTESIIFNRLVLRQHTVTAICITSPYVVFRQCVFEDDLYGICFHGADAAERGIVDRCLFNRVSDRVRGEAIYTTAPMTIRNSLFINTGSEISISAYTSKDDMFSGLKVIGNTFLHGGACITSTGKRSIIQNNVALGSRFVSSAGSEARIEGNFAVYDPKDLAEFPAIPRRNIGFRMYGRDSKLLNNTFVGFAQGGSIFKPEGGDGSPAHVEARGNKFYGYNDYALRVFDAPNLTSDDHLFVSATTNSLPIYQTPDQEHKEHLTLSAWQARGFDSNSVWKVNVEPTIPQVIRSAMQY